MGLLKSPKTPSAELLRALAQAAMSVTHHDADPEFEVEAAHEVETMERRFSALLRGKLRHPWASPSPKET